MAENKVDWTNFSFAQRFFKLEASGNVAHSVTPIGIGPVAPALTPQVLAAKLADPNSLIGRTYEIIKDELLEPEDQPKDLADVAHAIKGIGPTKK